MPDLLVEACVMWSIALQFHAADLEASAIAEGGKAAKHEVSRLRAMADLLELHSRVLADRGR